eukprot:s2049_g13.t1
MNEQIVLESSWCCVRSFSRALAEGRHRWDAVGREARESVGTHREVAVVGLWMRAAAARNYRIRYKAGCAALWAQTEKRWRARN